MPETQQTEGNQAATGKNQRDGCIRSEATHRVREASHSRGEASRNPCDLTLEVRPTTYTGGRMICTACEPPAGIDHEVFCVDSGFHVGRILAGAGIASNPASCGRARSLPMCRRLSLK